MMYYSYCVVGVDSDLTGCFSRHSLVLPSMKASSPRLSTPHFVKELRSMGGTGTSWMKLSCHAIGSLPTRNNVHLFDCLSLADGPRRAKAVGEPPSKTRSRPAGRRFISDR